MKQLWLRHKSATNMTQVQAAEQLGITQGSLTQYLNAHIAANTEFVLKFCRLVEADPAEADPTLANVLLASAKRIPVKYDWDGAMLPAGGPMTNVLVESDEALYGVRVPPEKTGLRRWTIAVIGKSEASRAKAITFIKVRKGSEWDLENECRGKDCWPVLAFVREK